jgi:RNA polymerase sigma factor (sigma-70 family)
MVTPWATRAHCFTRRGSKIAKGTRERVSGSGAQLRLHLEPDVILPVAAPIPAVYRRLLAPIRAKSRRMLGDGQAAEDVAQEAFVRLLQSQHELGPDADERTLVAWVYRTTTRLSIDALRDRARTKPSEDLDTLPCGVSPDGALDAKVAIRALSATTPPDELEAAVLCRVDGLSQPEAATVLGVSERTVRRLLERFDERSADLRREHAQ